MTSRYRVTERTQLNHEGQLYSGGDEVNLTNDEAASPLAAGTVAKVDDTKRRR